MIHEYYERGFYLTFPSGEKLNFICISLNQLDAWKEATKMLVTQKYRFTNRSYKREWTQLFMILKGYLVGELK